MKTTKNRNGKRVFVQPAMAPDEIQKHMHDLSQKALLIANQNRIAEGGIYPPADAMLYHISLIMVSLEMGITAEEIISNTEKYMSKLGAMASIFILCNEIEPFTVPEGFPYTIEEMKKSMEVD